MSATATNGMLANVAARLSEASKRHAELEVELSKPDVVSDHVQMQKLGREYARLSRLVKLGEQWSTVQSEIEDARQIIAEESDAETVEWANSVLAEQLEVLPDLESQVNLALMPPDETADADAVLEVRAGTGGDEAALFAAELYRMFLRYAERNGWKTSIVNVNETGIGGIKEVVFEIAGESAYSKLKHESGVHRVQRVPATESQGRIHTSAATVAVLPKAEDIDVEINDNDLKVDIFHAGGHGGQNVNKVATAVRITHEPSGIVVQCQNERSQLQNKIQAMGILRARLWDMELRKQRDAQAANRKAQVGSGDRSEKVRTYNFPQSRVTDHRINYTSHNLARVLDGEIDELIDSLMQAEAASKLAALAS